MLDADHGYQPCILPPLSAVMCKVIPLQSLATSVHVHDEVIIRDHLGCQDLGGHLHSSQPTMQTLLLHLQNVIRSLLQALSGGCQRSGLVLTRTSADSAPRVRSRDGGCCTSHGWPAPTRVSLREEAVASCPNIVAESSTYDWAYKNLHFGVPSEFDSYLKHPRTRLGFIRSQHHSVPTTETTKYVRAATSSCPQDAPSQPSRALVRWPLARNGCGGRTR